MKNESRISCINNKNESGVALATVILVTVLLTTAIIALLSAAANHSKNVTDVMSETKAYYAAESGLQATVNVLRNDSTVDYIYADANPTLSTKLAYNYPTSGTADRVVIGEAANTYNPKTGSAYSVFVEDPDNSSAFTTLSTSGFITSYTGSNFSIDTTTFKTIYICETTPCNSSITPRTEITFNDAASSTVFFNNNLPDSQPTLGSFTLASNGVDIGSNEIKFRIDYKITAPRESLRNIRGSIKKDGSNLVVTFQSQKYELIGSEFELCLPGNTGPNCPDVALTLSTVNPVAFNAYMTPVEPYRLRILSTGYGPNGARKQLEAFIQKNFFNDGDAPAPLMMQGPNASFYGSSAAYNINGVDNVNGITIPAVGVTDPASLENVDDCNCNPAPAIVTDVPDWMSSPQNLDTLINQLRNTAINSGRYFDHPTENLTNSGDYDSGTGITFCEGDCEVQNNTKGGGILVVTGTFTSNIWEFKGLIIITGAGGWDRTGGGNRHVIGNVVIAPYDPTNLSAPFLSPFYKCQGCGTSDVDYDPIALDNAFTGTKSISNFMLGIAEK